MSESSDTDLVIKSLKSLLDDKEISSVIPAELSAIEGFEQVYFSLLQIRDAFVAMGKGELAYPIKSKGYFPSTMKGFQSSLQHLVWQTKAISLGDFSQRVDFLGAFSAAFNSMTEHLAASEKQLIKKQNMLKAIKEATNELLANSDIATSISNSLEIIGKAAEVDRVYYFRNNRDKDNLLVTTDQKSEWTSLFCGSQINNPNLQNLQIKEISELIEPLSRKMPFNCIVRNLASSTTKKMLEEQKVLAILVLPIFIENEFWGFVGFDECKYEREWTDDDIALIMSFTNSISAAISRNDAEHKIKYLSYRDQLTGLYNRRFYEEELYRLDTEKNLPLSIAMGDVNGLKLTNDAFGHVAGDLLIKSVASILKRESRNEDIVARIGGDEFVMLLPGADVECAEAIINRIYTAMANEKVDKIILSISFGVAVKQDVSEGIHDVFKKAEDAMYKLKLSESSNTRRKTINHLMNVLYEKDNRERLHSKRVSEICGAIAKEMNFDENEINQIKMAGLMHDIGKTGIDENILKKTQKLDAGERMIFERHSEIGYRILSSVNEYSEIARYVLEHHERWDGNGYPKGLTGEQISLQARILRVADAYDALTSERPYRKVLSEEAAITDIKKCSGTMFDPDVARILVEKYLDKKW